MYITFKKELYNIEGNKLCNIRKFYHHFCLGSFFLDRKKKKHKSKLLTGLPVLPLWVLLYNQNLKDEIDWSLYLLLPCSIDRLLVTSYLIVSIDCAVFQGGVGWGLWPQRLLWIACLSVSSHQGSHTQPSSDPVIAIWLVLFMKSTLTD